MNRIEEMIERLCPKGVDMVRLGDYIDIYTGEQLNKSEMQVKGSFPVINGGILPSGYVEKYNEPTDTITISQGGASAGYVNFMKTPFWAGAHCFVIRSKKERLYNRYLYYYIKEKESYLQQSQQGAGIPSINRTKINGLQIPLPPLTIQREIVSVLDSFTTLIDKMKQEVVLRKKQMEYYREKMMAPQKNWEIKTLGEIGTFTRGNGLQKSDFRVKGFPCVHYGQIHTYYNTCIYKTKSFCEEDLAKKLQKASYGDLLIATTSEDVKACCKAAVWFGTGDVAYSGDSFCYSHDQNPKYMAYLFQTEMFAKQKQKAATGAKVIRVSGESIASFSFAFPPLMQQRQIASILDTFETYISKLEKMIELREKQYAYYREKLLTFE